MPLKSRISDTTSKGLVQSQLLRKLLGLYGIQVGNIFFPLLTLPYLSRVLGPESFGLYATGYALSLFLQNLLEYGLSLSGTREVSKHRNEREALAQLLASALTARFLLVIPAAFLSILAYFSLPTLKGQAALTLVAFVWAFAFSLNPTWFFLGLERVRIVALLEVAPRIVSTLGIFLFVKGPNHAYLPLLLNALATLLIGAIGFLVLRKQISVRLASPAQGITLLRQGFPLFVFRIAAGLQATAGVFILGLFAPSAQVGLYAAVDRLVKPLTVAWEPFNRLFSARLAYLAKTNPSGGNALGRQVFGAMVGLSVLGTILINIATPSLVHLFLGGEYAEGVGIMRILSIILPLSAVSHFLGAQWMLPHGMDRALAGIALLAVVFSVVVGSLFTYFLGALGMAWAEVLAMALVASARLTYLARVKRLPW